MRASIVLCGFASAACGDEGSADSSSSTGDGTGVDAGAASGPTGAATSDAVDGTAGGTGGTGVAGCGAPPPADPVAPIPCDNPQPASQVSADVPSGWIRCDNAMAHRESALECESPTDCTTDADCAEGEICECAGASSTCITAYCSTDADCGDGYHCWRFNGLVSCDGPHDRCRVEPCVVDGTVCENCEYDPSICAMTCIDYGPCTG